jgi:hypothetical protein
MKGEERMVCHFYRGNNMACKVRHGGGASAARAPPAARR